ncbi:MAG: pyrimidine reductase family protein [Acidimicrobiales bacterium]|nr:pyrimidine reductase family protein [Acidimicrobiales bacterium]
MRALFPEPAAEVDLPEAYAVTRREGDPRPQVRCNMISSLDGAISVGGRSGLLGGPADRRVFTTLRSVADVVLVGAGTARTEGYGPVRLDPGLRQRRRDRGQAEVPPVAVVTGSGNLDWSSPFFTQAEARPIVFVSGRTDEGVRERARDVADLVVAGDDHVDPRRIVDYFEDAGYRSVLLEGGPGLNADVVRAGLLDELCLTLSPRLVAGSGPRVLAGAELAPPLDLEPVHVLEEDGFLFLRLTVRPAPTT